jgi:hypothetical protein
MNKSKKVHNVYISIVILAIILLGVGWLYISSLNPTLEVKADQDFYFYGDTPQVEVMLHNYKNAESGKVVVSFTDEVISLKESVETGGVTMRQTEEGLIFELSKDFFEGNTSLISTLTFKQKGDSRGSVMVQFNRTKTELKSLENPITVENYVDAEFSFELMPSRGAGTQ